MDWHPNSDCISRDRCADAECGYPRDRHLGGVEHHHCGFCGASGLIERLVVDHCHITGLIRGHLCYSCNREESYCPEGRWELWRLTAPSLQHRRLYRNDYLRTDLEEHEVLTLPMEELLARGRSFVEGRKCEANRKLVGAWS